MPLIPCLHVSLQSKSETILSQNDFLNPIIIQAQGGGQAIEDGAALGILLDQKYDEETLKARLALFEGVRRNRASSIQILSNSSPPATQSVRDAAMRYCPDVVRLENGNDINEYIWSFDVIQESKAALAKNGCPQDVVGTT